MKGRSIDPTKYTRRPPQVLPQQRIQQGFPPQQSFPSQQGYPQNTQQGLSHQQWPMIRSCSNIVIHTPTTRSFTKGHFILQQEGNSDSLIQTPNNPTPTCDKNKIHVDEAVKSTNKPLSWNKDSLVNVIVESQFESDNKKQFIERAKQILFENFIVTLNDWNQLSPEKKSKYPDFLVTVLDNACQQVFAVDTVGILESLITVSVEQLQRRSTVRNFKFSSFEHREAGKENVILAAAGNYTSFFRSITQNTAQNNMVRKQHYFTTIIGGSGSGKSRAACEIGSILRSAGQSRKLPSEFSNTCEVYIDFFNGNAILSSEKAASRALGLRLFIRALRTESNVMHFVKEIGDDRFQQLQQSGAFEFTTVMCVLGKFIHQSLGSEPIPLVLILDEFQTTLAHFNKDLLHVIGSYMCDLQAVNTLLVRDRFVLMPVIAGTLSSSLTQEMFLPTGYGVAEFPLPSFPINTARKLALSEGIPAEIFNGLELQRFWYVMSLVPRNLERAVFVAKRLLEQHGNVVPTGSTRDMFVQELFQKVIDELDTLYGELKQQQQSIGSTDLIPPKPYSHSGTRDTLLLKYALTGVPLDNILLSSWISDLEQQGKIYMTTDRRLFLPYIIFKRLLEINNIIPSDCCPLLRRYFYWQDLECLDMHVLSNRISLFFDLGDNYVQIQNLFPGCYGRRELLNYEVQVRAVSFARESQSFIHKARNKPLWVDNPSTHPIFIDSRQEAIDIGSGEELDYIFAAPVNHPKVDARWFTKSSRMSLRSDVLFVIQYKHTSNDSTPPTNPVDWRASFAPQLSKEYTGFKIVYVYITNANIKKKAEEAVEAHSDLIVIDGAVASSYFSPVILPYFTFVDPTQDTNKI